MGRYKCLERSDVADPESLFIVSPFTCESRVVIATFSAPQGMRFVGSKGEMEFKIDKLGSWQVFYTCMFVCLHVRVRVCV